MNIEPKNKSVKDMREYVASAVAELTDVRLTQVAPRSAGGFYCVRPEVSYFVRFDDIDYKAWVNNPPEGVTIQLKTSKSDGLYRTVCTVSKNGVKHTCAFVGETQRDSELVATLKGLLYIKKPERAAPKSEDWGFDDRMAALIPVKQEDEKRGWFARLFRR